MIKDQYLNRKIGENLLALNELERANHQSSYRLSASALGLPTQWQVLKVLGIGQAAFDEYTLRKFLRGKEIEKWLLTQMPGVVAAPQEDKQLFVEYQGVIGFVDAMVDTSLGYDFNLGIIPHEIKSVSNAKFKRITLAGKADLSHKLQGTLYALATNSTHYAIDYVASDDLRVETYVYEAVETVAQVEKTILDFNFCLENQVVPIFDPKEGWQKSSKYQQYPEWANLTFEEVNARVQELYPDAWQKLIENRK